MKILVSVVLLCLIAIAFYLFSSVFRDDCPRDVKIAHQILGDVSRLLTKRYDMHPAGISEAGDKDGYTQMGLLFQMNRILGKEEGCKILIDAVKELLNAVNNSPDLQPYLIEKPFTEKNVEITVYPMGKDRRGVTHPDIQVFSARNGTVFYKTQSPDNEYGYHTIEEETFEEAVKKLEP